MATLNKLTAMKDAEIQHWLRKVERVGAPILARALLGADAAVHERVLRNLSETAAAKLEALVAEARTLAVSKAEIEYDTKRLELLL